MIEKQFGYDYGPVLHRGDKAACIVSLQTEIDRLSGVPYGWMRIFSGPAIRLLQSPNRSVFPVAPSDCSQSPMQHKHLFGQWAPQPPASFCRRRPCFRCCSEVAARTC